MSWKQENGSPWNAAAVEGIETCCESLRLSAVGNHELTFQHRVWKCSYILQWNKNFLSDVLEDLPFPLQAKL